MQRKRVLCWLYVCVKGPTFCLLVRNNVFWSLLSPHKKEAIIGFQRALHNFYSCSGAGDKSHIDFEAICKHRQLAAGRNKNLCKLIGLTKKLTKTNVNLVVVSKSAKKTEYLFIITQIEFVLPICILYMQTATFLKIS